MDELLQQRNELEQELKERLASTESPFTWMPRRSEFEAVSPQYILKNNVPKAHNDNLTIYSKYMRKVFELGNQDDVTDTCEALIEWENFLINTKTQDAFFMKNNLALEHVLYSSKAHLMLKMKDYEEVQILTEKIENIECNSDHLKAALVGLKAKFFDKYGSEGHCKALPYTQEAMKLDPNEPEWIYLTAKTMRDIRRGELYNMDGTEQSRYNEVELFEKLISIKRKGIYLIRLGNSYHDLASYLIYKNRTENHRCHVCKKCRDIRDYYTKGVECFREGIVIDPKKKNYYRVIRGINGMCNSYVQNYKGIARTWVNKVLKEDFDGEDKSDGFYVIGKYYQKVEKNSKGIEYITMAANQGCLNAKKDLIRMRFDETSKTYDPYNPEEEILEIMNTYPDRTKKIECYCQLASYYLFIEEELFQVIKFIRQEQEVDPGLDSLYLRKHKSGLIISKIIKTCLKMLLIKFPNACRC